MQENDKEKAAEDARMSRLKATNEAELQSFPKHQ